jgi:hypothetical protein
MQLSEVYTHLTPITSLTIAIGAPETLGVKAVTLPTLEQAEAALDTAEKAQDNAGSDYAYWGYEGQRSYWACMVSLLKAAAITGPDNLPDVPVPDFSGDVVMDAAYHMEQFGERVLRLAQHKEVNHG